MKQAKKNDSLQKPSIILGNFLSSVSRHLQSSSEHLFKELKNQISNIKKHEAKQTQHKVKQSKNVESNSKQNLRQSIQTKMSQKNMNNDQKNKNPLGIGKMFSFLKEKQQKSNDQLIKKLSLDYQITSPKQRKQTIEKQPSLKYQQVLVKDLSESKKLEKQVKDRENIGQIDVEKLSQQKASSMQQVEQFCNTLREQYNNQIYNKDWVTQFVENLQHIVANNAYICVQQTFQLLKKNFYPQSYSNGNKKAINNIGSGSRLNHLDTLEFNLQLTIKSRNSKNSFNFEARDSLTYSNATSFGLNSTQNRSKPLNKNDVSIKPLPPNHSPSLRLVKTKDENETDIAHIQRAQSRGQISRQNSRQQTPNIAKNVGKSQSLFTQEEKYKQPDYDDYVIKNSPQKLTSILDKNRTPIKQQHHFELIPLTQQNKSVDKQKINSLEKQMDTNKSSIKKSFSINNYTDRLKLSRNSTSKKLKDQSLFSNEISHFQDKISRIKEAKLAKKLQLQEELKRINNQIQGLKVDEGQDQTKRQKTSNQKSRQNTLESRIKINDNLQQKKQALNLVRNLRAQKMSRQNMKRKKTKVLNTDLHQQIQDIMRLKYFNQQRVKQKKKLQIIERMKQQQMRKIEEEKRKQESLQFLAKLKGIQRQKEIRNAQKQNNEVKERKVKINHVKQKQNHQMLQEDEITQSPNKISRGRQQANQQTPTLEKKKAYLSRRRNLNLMKRTNEDKYEQALG